MKRISQYLASFFGGAASQSTPEHPIVIQIRNLKKRDFYFEVFGAKSHRYKLKKVSSKDLEDFESWCGVTLPSIYRSHLREVGVGAGPSYGLLSIESIRKEMQIASQRLGPDFRISGDFPLTIADAESCIRKPDPGGVMVCIDRDWPLEGCIPICHHGCAYYTVLQLTGENKGCVWAVNFDGGWLPDSVSTAFLSHHRQKVIPPRKLATLPTFEDWFQCWLDHASTNL